MTSGLHEQDVLPSESIQLIGPPDNSFMPDINCK